MGWWSGEGGESVSNKLLGILAGVVALLVAGIVALTIVIVNSGGSSGAKTPAQANGNANASGSPAASSSKAPSSNVPGGVLKLPGSDPLTLDPAIVTDADSSTYIVEIFGGLVQLDKNMKVIPDIASSWTVSPDGTVYTFKLRNDVVFQNSNRRVTAQDFKYSMERACDPSTNSTTADEYLGDIVGAKDMIRGNAKNISGIKVIDDQTLQITIDAPKPYFLAKLTYPTAYVVDQQQINADKRNWTMHPNGTGPFILKSWKIGESVTLVANPRYHLGAPKVGEIDFNLAGGSPLTQYENGEVDIAGVGLDDLDRVRDPSDPLSKEYMHKPLFSTEAIEFNTTKAPFDDPKVRQAFGMAIDRDQLVNVVLKGAVQKAEGIMPPGMPGYNQNIKGLPFDPNQAKQLLQQSKYAGKLPPITFTTSGQGADVGPVLDAIIQMWKDNLGVDVQIQQEDPATFLDDEKKGALQIWDFGWIADYPDPEDFLDLNFYSQGNGDDTKYNNPQVDQLLLAARTEQDQTKRFQEYNQAEQQIVQDAPWIPLFWDETNEVVKPYVQGYDEVPIIIPIFRYVSLNK
jgi:oligopeptide transport system substrate-binding protein